MDSEATVSHSLDSPNPTCAIELRDVGKSFGPVRVLDHCSLSLAAGERFVLLGPSGCGKSTLVRLIAGLERPTSGSITIDGIDQSSIPPHQRPIAMVFQQGGCYEHLSVEENIRIGSQLPTLAGPHALREDVWPARKGAEFNRWLVDRLGLANLLRHPPTQLSGGEYKRLAIARSLASQRPILLLDEPLAHLNGTLRQDVLAMLLELQRETSMTLLYVTHDSIEAMQIAQRAAILDAGSIQQIDEPRRLYEHPQSRIVAQSLGIPTMDFMALIPTTPGIGIRPDEWEVVQISKELVEPHECMPHGFQSTADGIRWHAIVERSQFMGYGWWLSVRSGGSDSTLRRATVVVSKGCFEPYVDHLPLGIELFVSKNKVHSVS